MPLDEYQSWVAASLAASPDKNQSDLARALKIGPDKINKILAGTRKVQATEIVPIAECLGVDPPSREDFERFREFLELLPNASEEARASALTTLRLGQPRAKSV